MKNKPCYILLFDGKCAMCNYWVRFVSSKRTKGSFKFIAQDSKEGKIVLKKYALESICKKTLIVIKVFNENQEGLPPKKPVIFIKSSAVILILWNLSFYYKLLAIVLYILPKYLRDKGYEWVANNRHSFYKN
ncbi:MAG: DCC1-like thiol-disulfide oxidoreductase family protein [Alphaproteobacteria bacterium]|nr:DCC1-like thiol-disulfide oxidoreductase family protein [Alphaproteobacteria bacterium]